MIAEWNSSPDGFDGACYSLVQLPRPFVYTVSWGRKERVNLQRMQSSPVNFTSAASIAVEGHCGVSVEDLEKDGFVNHRTVHDRTL